MLGSLRLQPSQWQAELEVLLVGTPRLIPYRRRALADHGVVVTQCPARRRGPRRAASAARTATARSRNAARADRAAAEKWKEGRRPALATPESMVRGDRRFRTHRAP